MSTSIVLLVIVAIVVVAFMLGNFVSRSWRMPETGWKVSLIIAVIGLAGVILATSGSPKQGIDLKGGTILIYDIDKDLTKETARRQGTQDAEDGQEDGSGGDVADDLGSVDMPGLIQALSRRINPGGVHEIVIRQYGDSQVEIIIPDASDEDIKRVKKLITTGGFLKFMIVANQRDHANLWELADSPEQIGKLEVRNADGQVVGQWVKLALLEEGEATAEDKYRVDPPQAKSRMVRNRKEVLMAVDPNFNLQGSDLASVRKGFKDISPCVFFDMTVTGATKMGGLTQSNLPDPTSGHYALLGIVMDNELISAPRINETITSSGIIEGRFTNAEVDLLVSVLRAGKLPAVLHPEPIAQNNINALLGKDTIRQGKVAIGISLAMVLVFMIVYYHFAGLVACVALIINLALILALMIFIGAAFSLPGMAGLVLTVGMSVDANVLIYERIREELRHGAALRMAIRNGFSRATHTIVDANVTTLITGLVLYGIGTEQLKSFAVTLILGILMCMFTAIFVSRVIFDIAERRRWVKKLTMLQIFYDPNYNFFAMRHAALAFSVVLILLGLVAMGSLGQQIFDIDFLGGTSVQMVLNDPMTAADVRARVDQLRTDGTVQDITVTGVQSSELADGIVFRIDTSLPKGAEVEGEVSPVGKVQEALIQCFTEADGRLLLKTHQLSFTQPVKPQGDSRDAVDPGASDTPFLKPDDGATSNEESVSADGPQAEVNEGELPAEQPGEGDSSALPQAFETRPVALIAPALSSLAMAQVDPLTAGSESADPSADVAVETNSPAAEISTLLSRSSLTFDEKVNAETLEELIKETAKELGLSEPEVIVENPAWDGRSNQGFENWQVDLSTDLDQTQQILDTLEKRLDTTPVWYSANSIGGSVAGDKSRQAIAAVVASFLGIIGYIWVRFQRVIYGLAAVIALIHDVLATLGGIALSHWLSGPLAFLQVDEFKISLPVVAAILTIIGYSLNDTIVTFDRIRELKGKSPDLTVDMINQAVNQTLSRTILTSLTTLIVVVTLYAIGGQGIHAFAFALLVGVVAGTYSTVFIACPALLWMSKLGQTKKSPEKVAA